MKNKTTQTIVAALVSLVIGLFLGYKVDVTQLRIDVAVHEKSIQVIEQDIGEIKGMIRNLTKVGP